MGQAIDIDFFEENLRKFRILKDMTDSGEPENKVRALSEIAANQFLEGLGSPFRFVNGTPHEIINGLLVRI